MLNLDSLSGLLHDIIMLSSFLHYTGKLYFGGSVVSLKLQFETVFFILVRQGIHQFGMRARAT